MLEEAKAEGLLVNPWREREVLGRSESKRYVAKPDPDATLHESLTGAWNIAEVIPKKHYDWAKDKWGRRMNWWRRRTMPPGSLVHEAAWVRSGGYKDRLPADAVRVGTGSDGVPPASNTG
jgi:hypothetical protein